MKRRLKFLSIAGVILLIFAISLVANDLVLAGGMTSVTVVLADASGNNVSSVDTAVDTTTITFDPDTAVNTDDGININFASDFDISGVVDGDVSITQANGGTDITKGAAAVSGQNLQITIDTEGDTPGGLITVTIENGSITTPTTEDTFAITITTYDLGDDAAFGGAGADADTLEDSGAAAVVIGDNLVNISGTVDPSLTLDLSASTCVLGTLSSANIQTCQYNSTISTNATSGYTAYIKDDGDLRNATNEIDDVAGGTTEYGVEEYGVSTSDNDVVDISAKNSAGTCTANDGGTTATNALALTESDQSYATTTLPVSSDVVTLCHSASVSGTTPAGAYAHVTTITVVGNF